MGRIGGAYASLRLLPAMLVVAIQFITIAMYSFVVDPTSRIFQVTNPDRCTCGGITCPPMAPGQSTVWCGLIGGKVRAAGAPQPCHEAPPRSPPQRTWCAPQPAGSRRPFVLALPLT